MFKVSPLKGNFFTNDVINIFPFLKLLFRICFQEEPFWLCSNWMSFSIFSIYRMCTVAENGYFLHMNEIIFSFSVVVYLCHLLHIVLLAYLYVKMKIKHFNIGHLKGILETNETYSEKSCTAFFCSHPALQKKQPSF